MEYLFGFIIAFIILASIYWIGSTIASNDVKTPTDQYTNLGKLYVHNCTECGQPFSFNESEAEKERGFYKIQCPHCGKHQYVKK